MPNNVLVTGCDGQLGSELQALTQSEWAQAFNFFFTNRSTLDITKKPDVAEYCSSNNISHIINCAAYTAVDKAETETELADLINHKAVGYIAEVAKQQNVKLIHISTDYVFNGENFKPYVETDTCQPQSVYGQTKLDGEIALKNISPSNSIIIRTSWVFSRFGNNFVKTMLKLGRERDELSVIFDQVGTPTHAYDLALTMLQI